MQQLQGSVDRDQTGANRLHRHLRGGPFSCDSPHIAYSCLPGQLVCSWSSSRLNLSLPDCIQSGHRECHRSCPSQLFCSGSLKAAPLN